MLFHPLGSFIFLDRSFCSHSSSSLPCKVFSLSYNYFSTVFQVLTRNICQKCFPYWVLVLVFHLLGLCSPYSNTFEFYISHLIRPYVSFCICWVWSSPIHHRPLISLLPISTFHFQSLIAKWEKKNELGPSLKMMPCTLTESKALIMRTIKMKSFILWIPKSSNIHASMNKIWEKRVQ